MLFLSLLPSALLAVPVASEFPSFTVNSAGPSDGYIFAPSDSALTFNQCSTSVPPSCQNTTTVSDLCCFEYPGGLMMQTQFWNTDPSDGPNDSWTIHGLWADDCDGSFLRRECDGNGNHYDIAQLLSEQGAQDTLDFMQTYWVDYHGKNEHFWEHEWETHGVCMNTVQPKCLPDGSPEGAEAVGFFKTVVRLFKTLPTYNWLANGGITPSSTESHTLNDLLSALQSASGVVPALECKGSRLISIYWYFNLQGSVIDGNFIPIDAPGRGNCHESQEIWYLPKD